MSSNDIENNVIEMKTKKEQIMKTENVEVFENYVNGKKEGLYLEWYKNGQKKKETNYKDGILDGLKTHWDENGGKTSETNYKEGKPKHYP